MADVDTVRNRVQGILTEMGSPVIDGNGDYSFEDGSTRVFIRLADLQDFTVVNVFAPVLRNVYPTPDLYKYVAEATNGYVFGLLALSPNEDGSVDLNFHNHLLGEQVEAEELKRSVYGVASVADDLDDKLKSQFGGLRFVDA